MHIRLDNTKFSDILLFSIARGTFFRLLGLRNLIENMTFYPLFGNMIILNRYLINPAEVPHQFGDNPNPLPLL